ncbi:hypothetical protein, partial [Shewanella psychromarinicola]|uniref:hypothetical protein n=1 Tax=Shewanella psychromarinicola TaxID=2487742 RepID=UPI00200E3DD2
IVILLDSCQGRQGLVSIYDGAKDVFLSFLPQSGFVQQTIQADSQRSVLTVQCLGKVAALLTT